jgi:CRP-like cAMP-binding protein
MPHRLLAYFSAIMPLSAEESAAIAAGMCIRTFPEGTVLLSAGQISKECYFVLSGCVRQYYLVEGVEITSNFFTDEQWAVSLKSFSQQVPADHYFACGGETTLVIGNREKENALYQQFPRLETIARRVIEQAFSEQQQHLATYVTDTPEQRYLHLLDSRPDLIQRVPQYHLASYIGVTPESLSRIRKRLALRKKL